MAIDWGTGLEFTGKVVSLAGAVGAPAILLAAKGWLFGKSKNGRFMRPSRFAPAVLGVLGGLFASSVLFAFFLFLFSFPVSIPPGAVVAVSVRAEPHEVNKHCPRGWAPFEEARGRVIIGAGTPSHNEFRVWSQVQIDGSSKRISLSTRKPYDAGGEEAHVISVGEMPPHNHGGRTGGSDHLLWADETGFVAVKGPGDFLNHISRNHSHGIALQGEGQAHNTLPPYISLYFCYRTSE